MSKTFVESAEVVESKDSAIAVQLVRYKKHTSLKSYIGKDMVLKNNSPSVVFVDPNEPATPSDMLKRFGIVRRDQTMFPNNSSLPTFGDFSSFKEFSERASLYTECQNQFSGLPAEIRDKFGNDLGKFAVYVNSSDFNVETLMTNDFKEHVYKPYVESLKHKNEKKEEKPQ